MAICWFSLAIVPLELWMAQTWVLSLGREPALGSPVSEIDPLGSYTVSTIKAVSFCCDLLALEGKQEEAIAIFGGSPNFETNPFDYHSWGLLRRYVWTIRWLNTKQNLSMLLLV